MSTRGHVVFRVDGVDKVMYNHTDSYPSWLGEQVTAFIRQHQRKGKLFKKTIDSIRALRVVSNANGRPTKKEQEKYARYFQTVSEGTPADWYALLRELQGDLNETLKAGVMVDGSKTGGEEWTYIIDVDASMLRIQGGMTMDIPFRNMPCKGCLNAYLGKRAGRNEIGNPGGVDGLEVVNFGNRKLVNEDGSPYEG